MSKWSLHKEKRQLEFGLEGQRKKQLALQGNYDKAMSKAVSALEDGDDEKAKMYLAIAEHTKAQIELASSTYGSSIEMIGECEKTSAARNAKWGNWVNIIGSLATGVGFGALTYNLQKDALHKAYENDRGGELVNKKTLQQSPKPVQGIV